MRDVVAFVLISFCACSLTAGCGETAGKRTAIADFMLEQMETVKKDPDSDEGKAAFAKLLAILNGEWSFARGYSCSVFIRLGSDAAPAVPDLIRAASCRDELVEQEAVHALAGIGPEAAPAVDLFIEIIEAIPAGYDPGLKGMYAFEGLSNIGVTAQKAIPVLEKALQSSSDEQVRLATKALQKLNPMSLYESNVDQLMRRTENQ